MTAAERETSPRAPRRVGVACPLCGEVVSLSLIVDPRISFRSGSGSKGFVTADVGISGIEHTCQEVRRG